MVFSPFPHATKKTVTKNAPPTPHNDTVMDHISKIQHRRVLTRPAEVVLDGHIDHDSIPHPLKARCILDLGAGRSYLMVNRDAALPFIDCLTPPALVQFADGSTHRISETTRVSLSLFSEDQDTIVTQHDVELFVIRGGHATGLQLLLGRDSINRFKLDVYGATTAMIGSTVMFRSPCSTTESLPQATPDFVNYVCGTLLRPSRLEGMPRDILDDLGGPDETVDAAELQDLAGHTPDKKPLDIQIGPPDTGAPWGRLLIKIPWKDEHRPSPNFRAVWARDQITCRRLNVADKRLYKDAVAQLESGGFAIRCTDSVFPARHFIACRPVFKHSRVSTKCRLCLDARAINAFTHSGRDLSAPILECLLRFRMGRHVGVYDLDKAFWQIRFHESALGWYTTVVDAESLQFTSMVFGANYSPSGLEQGVRLVLERARSWLLQQPPTCLGEPPRPPLPLAVHNYVDDFCHRSNTSAAALHKECSWTRWFLAQYGFTSSKFVTNDLPVGSAPFTHSYLGHTWNLPSDSFSITPVCSDSPPPTPCTRVRDVVKTVSRLYDPLGLHLRLQLQGRLLVRAGFAANAGTTQRQVWNSPIPDPITQALAQWVSRASIPLPPVRRQIDATILHIFSDASQDAWVYEVRDSAFDLICARGGLTVQSSSIPRNELVALHAAVMDAASLLPVLEPTQVHFFVDSECTIWRLRRRTKLPRFEERRVHDILNTLPSLGDTQVVHVPGDLNPADHATRPSRLDPRPPLDTPLLLAYRDSPDATRYRPGSVASFREPEDQINLMVLRSRKNPVPRPEEPALTPNATEEQATDGQQTDTEREVENRRTRILQSQEKFITDIDEHMLFDQWGIIRKDGVILIPAEDVELQEEIIDRIHNRRHGGIQCTAREIGTHYIWRGMKTQVKRKVRACDTCQRARTTRVVRTTAGAALKLEDIEQVPVGSIVGIDVMTIEPVRDDRASCVITCTCLLSKWVRAKPMRTQTASEVVDALETMFREAFLAGEFKRGAFNNLDFRRSQVCFGISIF